jgi:hypothetical protein
MNKEKSKRFLKRTLIYFVIPILLLIFLKFKISISIIGGLILIKFIQIKRRGYFLKDINGNKLKFKEFMKRWREGIEGITPLQQAKTILLGNWIVVSGILSGMVINALVRMNNQWWWIEIILGGSLILVIVQMIGGFQKYWRFKAIEKAQKELE